METEKLIELEQRLALVESDLEATRAQNRVLRQRCRRNAFATRYLYLSYLIAVALLVGLDPSFAGALGTTPPQRPVTRLEAPVTIVGKSGNSIVEISEDQGRYGLTVYGPKGESVFLGSSKTSGAGIVHVYGPGRKLLSLLNSEGFTAYNSAGNAAAAIGARSGGSGFMTLGTTNGDAVVEAGMTEDSRGIVRVYPLGGPPPTVIPKYIMGGKPK